MNDDAAPLERKRPYILVVDDNRITTKLMRRYLELHGFEADDASDGVECLEKVAIRLPDAIILDVMMPRLDGFETVKALKTDPRTAVVPVAIVTALNDMATQVRAVDAGADDFLTKPIEEKLLITKATMLTSVSRIQRQVGRLQAAVAALFAGDTAAAHEVLEPDDLP